MRCVVDVTGLLAWCSGGDHSAADELMTDELRDAAEKVRNGEKQAAARDKYFRSLTRSSPCVKTGTLLFAQERQSPSGVRRVWLAHC
jgi:hypothetical protein